MSMQARGGVPRYINKAVPTEGDFVEFPQLSIYVKVRVSGAAKLFTSKADMIAGSNAFPVTPTDPFDAPLEDTGLFIKGDAGAITADVAVFCRKA